MAQNDQSGLNMSTWYFRYQLFSGPTGYFGAQKNVGGLGFFVNDTREKWGFEIWPF